MFKSTYDTNTYNFFVLDNELRVILVHNNSAVKSSASLSVSVGSFDEQIPGTAHFLEHLLFMGSTKYPDENTYDAYVNKYGGHTNAYTCDTHTNYLFNINSENFIEALDMFSQMFISPLLNDSAVQRELKAVNSEFLNYCNSDSWRSREVLKVLSNPNHPFSKFSVGNSESLNIPNITNHVRDLYNSTYSSNLMNLCIVSNLDLNFLEMHVKQMFEQIQNRKYIRNKIYPPFFTETNKTIHIVPIKNQHKLEIVWQVQNNFNEYDTYQYKPNIFLSYLLGHEGTNSVLSNLKKLNYATSLYAGPIVQSYTYDLMSVCIILTNEGIHNTDKILNVLYSYIEICMSDLMNYNKCKDLYDDNKNTYNLTWTFEQNVSSLETAINIAETMHRYDFLELENMIIANYYFSEFNKHCQNLICDYISQLLHKNSIIKISSKQFEFSNLYCFSVEQWYKCLYNITTNTDLTFDSFYDLDIPSKNIFIPTDLSIIVKNEDCVEYPVHISEINGISVFSTKTNKFGLPRMNAIFVLNICNFKTNTRQHVLTYLLAQTMMSQLNDILYDAVLLGYVVSISCNKEGLYIICNGYNDKIEEILKIIIDLFKSCEIEKSFFDLAKEQLIKSIENIKLEESSKTIDELLKSNVYTIFITNDEKLKVLLNLNFEDLQCFMLELNFTNCLVLLEGNINNDFISNVSTQIKRLKIQNTNNYTDDYVRLPENNSDMIISKNSDNPKELNDCILVSYCYDFSHEFVGSNVFKLKALASLVNLFVSEPFFNELRTNQQLGYTVHSYTNELGTCLGKILRQNFLIQSPNTPCKELLNRIDKFIIDQTYKITNITNEIFSTYVNTLKISLSKPHDNLADLSREHIGVLLDRTTNFKYKKHIAHELDLLTKNDLISFFIKYYSTDVKRYVVNLMSTCLDIKNAVCLDNNENYTSY